MGDGVKVLREEEYQNLRNQVNELERKDAEIERLKRDYATAKHEIGEYVDMAARLLEVLSRAHERVMAGRCQAADTESSDA